MRQTIIHTDHRRQGGFNLIEIAIVLAVIGVVIGGIYVAASAVTENHRKQKAVQQMLQIVSNVRSLYASQSVGGGAPAALATDAALQSMHVFPADIVYDGTSFNAAYGPVTLTVNGMANTFIVTMSGISQSGCINMGQQLLGSAAAKTGTAINIANINTNPVAMGVDVPLATIVTDCSLSSNSVSIAFYNM